MSLSAQTISRRLLSSYWLDGWLGPARDQKTWNAAAVDGVDFDPAVDADCAPFTAAEVAGSVGFTRLAFDEVDTYPLRAVSGIVAGQMTAVDAVLDQLQFAVRIPADGDYELAERFLAELDRLFRGLSIRHDGPPVLSIRNLANLPPRRRGPYEDGSWLVWYFEVKFRRQERKALAGAQEVALP